MAFNIFKRKEEPIYLDCYTHSHYAYNHAKIDYGRRYFPEWWKDEKGTSSDGVKSIKHCRAFMDFYSKGIVMPLWGEVEIIVHPLGHKGDIYTWRASNKDFDLHSGNHAKFQWSGFGNENLFNIKFMSPWYFKTKELVHFVWSQPTWSLPNTFNGLINLPGVIEYKTQQATPINFVLEQKEEEQKFNLSPLTPIVMQHAMTERPIEIRHHLVSEETFMHLQQRAGGMLLDSDHKNILNPEEKGLYKKKQEFWQKADEVNKCPFE